MNYFLINQFADNKGDRAVLHVMLDMLFQHDSDARVWVSTSRPSAWREARFGPVVDADRVSFVPWAWNFQSGTVLPARLGRAYFHRVVYGSMVRSLLGSKRLNRLLTAGKCRAFHNALGQSDLVISVGGHHFTNWFATTGSSPLFFDLGLAILSGRPTTIWSQTIGPLDFTVRSNKQAMKRMLDSVKAIYIRDENSLQTLKEFGVSTEVVHSTLETVFGIDIEDVPPVCERPSRVGISIYTGPERDSVDFESYVDCLAEYTSFATERGFEVVFFPMQIAGQRGDDRMMIRRIKDACAESGRVRILERDMPTLEHVKEVAQCRVFVAHKTHAVVFSLCTGTPTIAIAYHKKTKDFMELYGMEKHCISEDCLSAEWLREQHRYALLHGEEMSKRQREITAKLRQRVMHDFSEMIRSSTS